MCIPVTWEVDHPLALAHPEQLQGALCSKGPGSARMVSLWPRLRGFKHTSAQQQPPRNSFHAITTTLCFKHRSWPNTKSQHFIHSSSPSSCPRSQCPCGSHHSTQLGNKVNLITFMSQGIKISKSKVSWVRKLLKKTQIYFTCLS